MSRSRAGQVTIHDGEWTFRVRADLAERFDEIRTAVFSAAGREDAKRVKETGGRRTIWISPSPGSGLPELFIKHYSKPRLTKQIKHLARNSRTRQEWEMGLALESLGLPAARHICMAERRSRGLLQEDYLAQEALTGYVNYDAWFRENVEGLRCGAAVRERREVIDRTARLIREMHDAGVLQRDFKPDGIMVGPEGDFKLVDLERALVSPLTRGLCEARRLDNLAKIDQTFGFTGGVTDRLRFLKSYFGAEEPGVPAELRDRAVLVSRLAELKFRKRARERRVWGVIENETYYRTRRRGFTVQAHRSLPEDFVRRAVTAVERGGFETMTSPAHWGFPEQRLAGVWCDAVTAMCHTPSLYYRKAPFLPARAAIFPGEGPWGFLLYVAPGDPLVSLVGGAALAREREEEERFGRELGRWLKTIHRMGMGWREVAPDMVLHDPEHPEPGLRYYVNRLDLLVINRGPRPGEAVSFLRQVSEMLSLSGHAEDEMWSGYRGGMLRWFRAPDRW